MYLDKEIEISLSVIVEKVESTHQWGTTIYRAVEVIMNPIKMSPWTKLTSDPNKIRYHAGIEDLVLNYKEAEAYKFNLESAEPSLFIIMREDDPEEEEESLEPVNILLISASPYDAQDYDDVNDMVDRVPIPASLYLLIEEFINVHYREEKFVKRKRDRVKVEDHKFGKEPIFHKSSQTKH